VIRHIRNLRWAKQAENPWPKSRPRAAKAVGLRYERKVAKELRPAEHNPWYEYEDDNGHGFCSPDLVMPGKVRTLVMECKLSNWREGWEQVEGLYLPVLKMVFGQDVVPVVIVRRVSPGCTVAHSLREAVELWRVRPVLLYIGQGPFPLE
jgi:hypothetical protein